MSKSRLIPLETGDQNDKDFNAKGGNLYGFRPPVSSGNHIVFDMWKCELVPGDNEIFTCQKQC